ncbi:MAG: hypothetical protein JNM68_03125 [Dinghuibacter sp.]|nr:hypothetical protein [Dinghuibacter sp.]
MKKTAKKLNLKKATVSVLAMNQKIAGGGAAAVSGNSCSQRFWCNGTYKCCVLTK